MRYERRRRAEMAQIQQARGKKWIPWLVVGILFLGLVVAVVVLAGGPARPRTFAPAPTVVYAVPTVQEEPVRLVVVVAIATPVANAPAASPVVTATPTVTTTSGKGAGLAAAPEVVDEVADVTAIPVHAVKLEKGVVVIPAWGYGPWGQTGFAYPKVQPGGTLPLGVSQLVTDFDGRNWLDHGKWSFTVPSNVTEISVTVQGDAPAKVLWEGGTLSFWTDAEVSAAAPDAEDNAPKPTSGSTGVSLVVFAK